MKQETEATALSRTLAGTETLQLAEVHTLDAFYTPIEERFERITRLGRCALGVPVVGITAITLDTQWFKSVSSWNVSELPIKDSLCERTVRKGKPVMVHDLSKNLKYANHPLVVGEPKFRFYAGIPLHNVHGTVIGTLCAMDVKPREKRRADQQVLTDLAALAQCELLTVALHNAQTELISKLSIARRQALLDPLTRIWNRRGGKLLLEGTLKKAADEKKSVAVCAVDLNDFKSVNDTFGHAAGDRALRMVAKELLACVRDTDGVCRLGGDEFFVVIVGIPRAEVDKIIDRIMDRIRHSGISVNGGRKTNVSVCVGVNYVEAADISTSSADELLAGADRALYDNKMERQLRVDCKVDNDLESRLG